MAMKRPTIATRMTEQEQKTRTLMATAAELQTAVDNLTAAVAKVSADIALLKAAPPVVQNVEQAQLDANTTAIADSVKALNAL